MDPITIQVTAEHIARGKRKDAMRCPIALAVIDASGYTEVDAYIDYIFIIMENAREAGVCYGTPKMAEEFIRAFDDGEPVEPFAFTLGEEDRVT